MFRVLTVAAVVATLFAGALASALYLLMEIEQTDQLHFILRPDSTGAWVIQEDEDHRPRGVLPWVEQTDEFLKVRWQRQYSHVGAIQITPDDQFAGLLFAGAGVGRTNTTIVLRHQGVQINPAHVHRVLPDLGGGNFWVTVTMVQDDRAVPFLTRVATRLYRRLHQNEPRAVPAGDAAGV